MIQAITDSWHRELSFCLQEILDVKSGQEYAFSRSSMGGTDHPDLVAIRTRASDLTARAGQLRSLIQEHESQGVGS